MSAKFKVGDWIAWDDGDNNKFYEKILEIREEDGDYIYSSLRTGVIYKGVINLMNCNARLMTDEEKVELL